MSTTTTTAFTPRTKPTLALDNETETMINKLINIFLSSSYRCTWASYYFDRPEVGMFGVADLNRFSASVDVAMARGLLEYLKIRGGRVIFDDVKAPNQKENQMEFLALDEKGDIYFQNVPSQGQKTSQLVVSSVNCIILGKRATYDYVIKLYQTACASKDPHLTDFLEVNFIRPMGVENRKLGVLQSLATLACSEEGVGVYQFNKDIEKHLFEIMTANKLARPDKWSFWQ